jgi:hypothetical protein
LRGIILVDMPLELLGLLLVMPRSAELTAEASPKVDYLRIIVERMQTIEKRIFVDTTISFLKFLWSNITILLCYNNRCLFWTSFLQQVQNKGQAKEFCF